jgi:hypothetical protein
LHYPLLLSSGGGSILPSYTKRRKAWREGRVVAILAVLGKRGDGVI